MIALVNTLVTRDGITVLVRGFDLPVLGTTDITLEALAYSALLALRFLIVIGCAGLLAAAVDPDELLRAVRRVSARSGVTAAVATRLVPVLARDARRLADAQRARGSGDAHRVAILRAVTTGALDRATDVAATLEVRGFGSARRPARRRRPLSRHDLAFAASTRRDRRARGRDRRRGLGAVRGVPADRGRPARCCPRSRWPRARCCRSPTGGGSSRERARARPRLLRLSRRRMLDCKI